MRFFLETDRSQYEGYRYHIQKYSHNSLLVLVEKLVEVWEEDGKQCEHWEAVDNFILPNGTLEQVYNRILDWEDSQNWEADSGELFPPMFRSDCS